MSIALGPRARAVALPQQVAGTGVRLSWSRIAKIGGAMMVLALGGYAVTSDQVSIATDNAVVSAYAIALRTPIDGIVDGAPLRVGERVDKGLFLAQVSNSRVDDQRLVDLREHLVRARATLAAAAAESGSLSKLRDDLNRRSSAYVEASLARVAGAVAEADSTLAALNEKRDEAQRNLTRRSSLARSGFASTADFERAQSDFSVASREAEAQRGKLESLEAQAKALTSGVVSEPGSNDVTYSAQRADEISIRLDELARDRSLAEADVAESEARLQSEEARIAKLRTAMVVAPVAGMVWKLNASDGERLGTGDTVAQVVDCKASFVIAAVPQNRVPDIAIGADAEYRLAGDGAKHHGRVLSVTGDATGGDHNLAAIPFDQKAATATVRIALDPDNKGECLVGRTARVLLPASGRGVFSRLFSRFM